MKVKAKFSTSLSEISDQFFNGKNIDLYLFLSMGKNRKNKNLQQDEYLEAFIKLLNKSSLIEKDREVTPLISKLKVVLTGCNLYEYYAGSHEATLEEKRWIESQLSYFEDLNPIVSFNPTDDILVWNDVKGDLYEKAYKEIEQLYKEDLYLKKMVNDLIGAHSFRYNVDPDNKKAAEESVKKYWLSECAVFLTWPHTVCYPSSCFQDSIQYVLNKLTHYKSAVYVGYVLKGV